MTKSPDSLDPVYAANAADETVDNLPGSTARPSASDAFGTVLGRALSRRALVQGTAATGALFVVSRGAAALPSAAPAAAGGDPGDRLTFATVPAGDGTEPDVRVPANYTVDVVLRWGDPLFPSAPAFDVNAQTPAAQAQQFGFNADLVLWYPLPRWAKQTVERTGRLLPGVDQALGVRYPFLKDQPSRRALVAVNHEYTTGADMFPGYDGANPTQNDVETEIEAHGFSIVELVRDRAGRWSFVQGSALNKRVTGSTPHELVGPLRGDDRLKTTADPTGTQVLGCLNNCAGGKTPWGTVITCEENFDQYFANFSQAPADVQALSARIAAPGGASGRKWEQYVSRFDLAQEPNEYHRFGYLVEIDPYDPNAVPRKLTACGRFKHEGAAVTIAPDGRAVVYSGDDARFEYVYKFVSANQYDAGNRAANRALLEEGTLYVARFDDGVTSGDEMGTGEWLPLVWAPGNALDQAGFASQADVLLNTRGAADVLGATPMDRPEDIEINPRTGAVYVALTNNSQRNGLPGDTRTANGRTVSTAPNEANPRNDTYDDGDPESRTGNQHGHVVELLEDGGDAAAATFTWNVFIKCGDPAVAAHDARFGDLADPLAAGVSPIADPDNLVHDDDGNLWISTDGMPGSGGAVGFGQNDGVFAVPVEGASRGVLRQFLSGVPGGEICGPEFSGDNRTFFCAIQHPHDGEAFTKYWPLDETVVSKPALIAVRENSGAKIGS